MATPRLAMRVTQEYLDMIVQIGGMINEDEIDPVEAGIVVTEMFAELPYMVITPIAPTEFNMKLMTEEEMFEAFKDDNELHILN